MKNILLAFLWILPLFGLSQNSFDIFKENFKKENLPLIINSYVEEEEISEDDLNEYLIDEFEREQKAIRTSYFQSRFEQENFIGFIVTNYGTSGAGGVRNFYIDFYTTTHQGKLIDKVTLGCFCSKSNVMGDSEIETKVDVFITAQDVYLKMITTFDGEEPSISGNFFKYKLDEEGNIDDEKLTWELEFLEGQSSDYQLLTIMNADVLKAYRKFYGQSKVKSEQKRTFLEPYVALNDPLAIYKYATTYDLFHWGIGDSLDAQMALKYYQKAADLNYAKAEYQLFGTYEYNFMGIPKDSKKAKEYLNRATEHGDAKMKLSTLKDKVANAKDDDSKILYLIEMFELDSSNTFALDGLGNGYEVKKDFEKAAFYYLKSSNINMLTKVGLWYAEGKRLPKDLERGMEILKDAIERMEAKKSYQGSINPKHELNRLHYCEKLFPKERLGKYDRGYFICSPGG